MALHSWELQKTIFSTLNSANLTDESGTAIKGVFDDVPESTEYPYVRIGEDSVNNISTKGKDINEHSLSIDIWSQYRGMRDIKVIMAQIHNALDDINFSVTGALGINLKFEFQTTVVEPDGITRHGIMRFRAVVSDT